MKKQRLIKIIFTTLVVMTFALMAIASSSSSGSQDSQNANETEPQTTESTEKETDDQPESEMTANESVQDISDSNKEAFEKGKYPFITTADLNKYCPNLPGVKIYTVGKISDFNDDAIQINLGEGYMMSNFHTKTDYSSLLSKDMTVAIFGEVNKSTDYLFFGTSVDIVNCEVFAVGEEAESYVKEKSDKALSKYLVVTEAVANNCEVTEKEYKSICKTYNHKKILRNPDKYDGKYTKVSGKVDQIIEGWFGSYTIYVVDKNNKKWECSYTYKDEESHLLEGDKVKIYGLCKGTTTSTTLLGKQVTLPKIEVKYIN